jgi:choline kinase
MRNYKVCILAAGLGSRSFNPDINKALLPLSNKAIISHIIDNFDIRQKFVIVLGYNADHVKEYLIHAHPKNEFEFVTIDKYFGPGSGPGYSLLQCKSKLQCPFILTTADTIVLEKIPAPSENWIAVSPIKETINYCTVKTESEFVTRIDDKTVNDNKLAWVGLASINDYKVFFKNLEENQNKIRNEIQISNGLNGLIEKKIKTIHFTWYDTGSLENYIMTLEAFDTKKFDFSKPNEFLYIKDNRIIKFFLNTEKVDLLKARWKKLKNLTPSRMLFTKNFLSYEKFKGEVLYDNLNNKTINKLLSFLKTKLWKVNFKKDDKKFKNNCLNFYKHKTAERVKQFRTKFNLKDKPYKINGQEVESLSYYLNKINWNKLSEGVPVNFHGDLQFDNIIYNQKNKIFKLIDWRSDFNNQTLYGDLYYDLSKLYGGCILPYNQIKNNNFTFVSDKNEIFFDFGLNNSVNEAKQEFTNFLIKNKYDIKKIEIITSLIYLNMSPLHSEPFSHLLYFFGTLRLSKILK